MKKIYFAVCFLLSLTAFTSVAQATSLTEGFKRGATENTRTIIKKYGWMIRSAADEFNVSAIIAASIIVIESSGDPDASHPSTAVGLMGVKPEDALADVRRIYPDKYFSSNLRDPRNNIRVGVAYLAAIRDHYTELGFETPEEVAVAYADGIGTASKYTKHEIYSHPYVKKMHWVIGLKEMPTIVK